MVDSRRFMVDGQLRPNRVTDPFLLAAMGDLPRHHFLSPTLSPWAHADADVPLPNGRVLMQPMVIAKLMQLLALRQGDRVLVVGAGRGYAAAVLARMGGRVVALEADAAMAAEARRLLPGMVPPGAVTVEEGALAEGFAAGGPYDAILIEGEVPEIPATLSGQLAEGGRLATILAGGVRGAGPRAVLGRRAGASFALTDAFDAFTAPLPGFRPAPAFVF
jgi:protein-L-isoaspartate(D-aspartate) O-methyltransferase